MTEDIGHYFHGVVFMHGVVVSLCCADYCHSITLSPMKSFIPALFCYLVLSVLCQVVSSKSRGECLPVNDDREAFHCLSHNMATLECEDQDESCNTWARKGECRKNPGFMLKSCRKSCGMCVDIHVGEIQASPDAAKARAVLERLVATQDYIYAETEKNPQVFRKCRNGRLCWC